MKEIKLTQGYFALVDDEDFEYLNQFKWQVFLKKNGNTCYAQRSYKKGKNISMHREILGLTDPKIQGDHIDGNGLNNQRYNLRTATHTQNQRNRKNFIKGTSKYKGVSWDKKNKKWIVRIRNGGKQIYLGHFLDEIEAAKKYDEMAKIYHKEFAYINFKE